MMLSDFPGGQHEVLAHGKFFSRSGRPFLLKGMRLPELRPTLDFSGKLKLRSRLEELKATNANTVILSEAQSQPALDIVAAAGMVAMVEASVSSEDLLVAEKFASLISRISHSGNVYRGHRGLAGYLLDCVSIPDPAASSFPRFRRRMRDLVRTLHDHDQSALVAIKHRLDARHLAAAEEDFLYVETPPLEKAQLREFIGRSHRIAGGRPIVVDFTQPSAQQDQGVAIALSAGAAGVVAAPVPAPASSDWLNIPMLRAADAMPFARFDGAIPVGVVAAVPLGAAERRERSEGIIGRLMSHAERWSHSLIEDKARSGWHWHLPRRA